MQVKLDNVFMYYPARPKRRVLDGMNFVAAPGAVVALVGPSGGGKSSVISLIQHLYEATDGRIMIDGEEVHMLAPDFLSRNVTVVSQEPTLYARSVARNIMFGLEGEENEPNLAEIKRAASLANAHDFIENLPEGYDTEVGERGVQLSGGQKQVRAERAGRTVTFAPANTSVTFAAHRHRQGAGAEPQGAPS